ncbi:molybdopterin-dependent oxidoreductase-like protein [Luteibacter rhizovicinus]|uniref:Molybdopterin-dependent oxidoreductase-like protein n=1 Tax=Luteibacter rhizovicinus TaxID=242606 RepID=A0A4R3YPA9_9GAMM|nr:molybdopterin-dependent oxidoreductase [Luteibacter rhizovicinus]TCV94112.1 molybdopterin-dependent oxidoreductase-like protein [Luteibacter rhizovicinus]
MRSTLSRCLVICALMCAAPVIAADGVTAKVAAPAANRTIALDAAALAGLPRTKVSGSTHGDAPSEFEGVVLIEVLHRNGLPLDEKLRGRAMATAVRVTASDGYVVVFSLGELAPDFGATTVLIADRQNGKPIDAKDGPLRLVVPTDKRAARWVRNVTRIEVLNVDGDEPKH